MGDVRCGWCGAWRPGPAAHGRRCCRPAHRQAAWRARRRWQEAAPERNRVAAAGEVVLPPHVNGLAQAPGSPPSPGSSPGWHCAAVARIPDLAGELVHAAVLADRRAGAGWAQIGAGLGISAEAGRARFGRTRSGVRSGRSRR